MEQLTEFIEDYGVIILSGLWLIVGIDIGATVVYRFASTPPLNALDYIFMCSIAYFIGLICGLLLTLMVINKAKKQ